MNKSSFSLHSWWAAYSGKQSPRLGAGETNPHWLLASSSPWGTSYPGWAGENNAPYT